jgi:hypothetical protein
VYSSCLFCRAGFGANDAIEHLPVGRRIAYDAALGRLWLVCRTCGRWNLTPFDERWEAIDECERHFVVTRLRVFSDNVGLARLDEGLELVRIGKPLRPSSPRGGTGRRWSSGTGTAGSTCSAAWAGMVWLRRGRSWRCWAARSECSLTSERR